MYNMDEMNVNPNCITGKVVCNKHSKWYSVKKKQNDFRYFATVCCFSAIGEAMPIFLLSDAKTMGPEIKQLQEYQKMLFGYSQAGWMTREHFVQWARHLLKELMLQNYVCGLA